MPGVIKIGVRSYKDWEGVVYPQTLHGVQRLAYLAEFFDLVEINTSFYRPITPAMGKQWCRAVEAVNPRFLFTAKLYRAFTHSPISAVESTSAETIHATKADERDAKAGFDSIASQGRLGAVLAQFPISFKCTDENKTYVEKLVAHFHIYQWFAETNVRDRYDYLYSSDELQRWKGRIEEVAAKTDVIFVVANNHNLGKAAVNALELVHMLSGKKVGAPAPLVASYPRLQEITAGKLEV